MAKAIARKPRIEPVTVDLSAYESEGFVRLNPEPRYYNVEGADPLMCVVLDRSQAGKIQANAYYTCVAFSHGKNGDITNQETGEVYAQPAIEPGDVIRVGARHQIDDTFPKVVGRKAMVLLKPIRKVMTANDREVWQFAIMARPLRESEAIKLAAFTLADFETI